MSFSLATLSAWAVGYLLLLFLIAWASERWLPARWAGHPLVYCLSLGVYATTWSYYGSVGFAASQGILFLTIYLGVTLAFILTPVLLLPLLKLVRTHQLTSAADLFAFRFHSQAAGVLVTLVCLLGILPYIALQIRAVAETTQLLAGQASPLPLAAGFCVVITVFAIVFGARHVTPREKHTGLVVAVAFESLVKLLALLILAAVAMGMAFGGPGGLEQWLSADPERLRAFYRPGGDGPWASLLLIAMAAAFLLPRQFLLTFTENLEPRALLGASWGFPLFLLLLSLAVPPILWAGQALTPTASADYYVVGLAAISGSPALAILVYLGGISAASAMIIVETLALSSMTLNHLLLPLVKPRPQRDLYAALRWLRRGLIAALIGAGFGFYLVLERSQGLVAWGLISFLAMAQFLPGLAGVLWWSRASRAGFLAGLAGGTLIWGLGALLPALTGLAPLGWLGLDPDPGGSGYAALTFLSLSLNGLLFAAISLLRPPQAGEREAAAACRRPGLPSAPGPLRLDSPDQFALALAPVLGEEAARLELRRALEDLALDAWEDRPERLQLLRGQIERNLSGMVGPLLARMIVDSRLSLDPDASAALAQNLRLFEARLEHSRSDLRGMAAELDALRRYYRQLLEDLPLGVAAVAADGSLLRWNQAMADLSGISADQALGRQLRELAPPWGEFLGTFLDQGELHAYKQPLAGARRWFSLHRAAVQPTAGEAAHQLLLVEDVSERAQLERELIHSERLASIGRLAAGVAHEIGNPVTAIACLAQDLRQESDPAESQSMAEQVLVQTRRISNIVHTLVSYAHAGGREQARLPVALAEAVEEAVRVVRLSRRAQALEFANRLDPTLRVAGDGQRLTQVFVNLFSNAADAGASRVEISAATEPGRLRVTVADDGPGFPADIREQALEPFFTTKPAGQGTGLGLPLVYNILREHGGELSLDGDERGARVRLTLPLSETP